MTYFSKVGKVSRILRLLWQNGRVPNCPSGQLIHRSMNLWVVRMMVVVVVMYQVPMLTCCHGILWWRQYWSNFNSELVTNLIEVDIGVIGIPLHRPWRVWKVPLPVETTKRTCPNQQIKCTVDHVRHQPDPLIRYISKIPTYRFSMNRIIIGRWLLRYPLDL